MQYDYKKGVPLILITYIFWGFQAFYWTFCEGISTEFILVGRICFAAVECLLLLKIQGKLGQLADVFRNKDAFTREIIAAFFILIDWAVYIYAVKQSRIMECGLGYYIQPLVIFLISVAVFHEKMPKVTFIALAFIIAGIFLSVQGFGQAPYITIILSVAFAIYGAVKKNLDVDSIVSITAEMLILLPFTIAFALIFCRGDNGFAAMNLRRVIALAGSGVITFFPLMTFSAAIKNIPMQITGITQYLSPSLGIVCSIILGETLTRGKLISFAFVWVGIIIFMAGTAVQSKKS